MKNNLKALLEEKGISQLKLAEVLEVWPCTVSAWVAGQHSPSRMRLARICEFLSCKPSDIYPEYQGPKPEVPVLTRPHGSPHLSQAVFSDRCKVSAIRAVDDKYVVVFSSLRVLCGESTGHWSDEETTLSPAEFSVTVSKDDVVKIMNAKDVEFNISVS